MVNVNLFFPVKFSYCQLLGFIHYLMNSVAAETTLFYGER